MRFDLVIIGGGPGGYVAAIRAGQLGLKTALIEKEAVGGTCLHHGCIPSKVLLQSAEILALIRRAAEFGIEVGEARPNLSAIIARSEQVIQRLHRGVTHLLKKNNVTVYEGHGRFVSPRKIEVVGGEGPKTIEADHVIVATGSHVDSLPGFPIDGERIFTSDDALKKTTLPRSIVIVGGGAVGVEFAWFYSVFGVNVTIIEQAASLLPTEDVEVSALLKRSFEKRGIAVVTAAHIDQVSDRGDVFSIQTQGVLEPIRAEAILMAVGRIPNTDRLDLKRAGIEVGEGDVAIPVDERVQTSQLGIWAIGDVTTRPALAHGAMAQGVYVVETIAGLSPLPIDLSSVPRVVYCHPEVAAVGLTEAEARAGEEPIKVAKAPFSANPRAVIRGETEGWVKVISQERDGQILGAHIIGPGATELIAEFVLAKSLKVSALGLKRAIHPHLTLSETIMEAGGALFDQAIHL
jgi:dihydrolipoamide dehydrogenase